MQETLLRSLRLLAARATSFFIRNETIHRYRAMDVRVHADFNDMDATALSELVSLYKAVYGELDAAAGSVWGEGAYCSREGKLKKICLAEYEARRNDGTLDCSCGGTFIPFYEDAFVKSRLRSAFEKPDGTKIPGCLSLMTEKNGLIGFAWGSTLTGHDIIGKLNESLPRKLSPDGESRLNSAFPPTSRYFYFDEIAIERSFRKGLRPVLSLFFSTLQGPFREGLKDIVFWTERGSRVHSFAVLLGFKDVYDTGHGVVMTSSRLPAIIKCIYQYLTSREARPDDGCTGRAAAGVLARSRASETSRVT